MKQGKQVTVLNRGRVEDLYDFESSICKSISLAFLCNQIIHSYIIFPGRDETGNFSHILVCSDYQRNRFLYMIAIEEIVALVREVALNIAPRMTVIYDPAIKDYRITSEDVT